MKNYCINLFQNSLGEICAFVDYDNKGKPCHKLIENVEQFAKVPSVLLDYLLDGFSGFSDFDAQNYSGKDIGSMRIEMIEDGGYKLIVHFEYDGISTDYYFENMNAFAIDLLEPIKTITDRKAEEYDRRNCTS